MYPQTHIFPVDVIFALTVQSHPDFQLCLSVVCAMAFDCELVTLEELFHSDVMHVCECMSECVWVYVGVWAYVGVRACVDVRVGGN